MSCMSIINIVIYGYLSMVVSLFINSVIYQTVSHLEKVFNYLEHHDICSFSTAVFKFGLGQMTFEPFPRNKWQIHVV
jgi:hypothetical protein